MAGIFSKGGGVPLTPAQQQLQQQAIEQAQNFNNVWMPVQQYFASGLQQNAPGLQEQARGGAATTARAAGTQAVTRGLSADAANGAAAGSGRFLADAARGLDATGAATGVGLQQAGADAERHYVQGLQEVVGMGLRDQQQAQQGLNTAAGAQAQEAGAVNASNAASQQGGLATLGTIASIAAMFA